MAETPLVVDKELSQQQIQEILEEEAFLIKHSGETPEIAFHSGLYYLFEDPDGPKLDRSRVDLSLLKEAVFERYTKILLRDLKPANRDKRIYRGVARSIANWHRMKKFCQKEGFQTDEIRQKVAKYLINFLENEVKEVKSGKRVSCINCTYDELKEFARELGVKTETLPNGLEELCMSQ